MSSLVPETNWAQGASGPASVYPAGLGLAPSYLASASASASSSTTTSGTSFPTTPADGNLFIYTADAVNGIRWSFIYNASSASLYKWEAIGLPTPLFVEVTAAETTSSATYAALTTPGPLIALPALAGDYYVWVGGSLRGTSNNSSVYMSYDIGGTGAVDADAYRVDGTTTTPPSSAGDRPRRKNAIAASTTLTAKYRIDAGTLTATNRWLAVAPIRVTG